MGINYFKVSKNRKAAVSLGVNAIVILIIAVILLGIILGFLRGMFRNVQTEFEKGIAQVPEPPMPTAGNPITSSNDMIVINSGKQPGYFKISVYNNNNSVVTANISVGSCSVGNPVWIADILTGSEREIQPYSIQTFGVGVKTSKVAATDSTLCTVRVVGTVTGTTNIAWTLTKDFTVKVNP